MSKNNDNSSGNDLLADDDFEPLWWGTITISVSFPKNYTSPLDYANEIKTGIDLIVADFDEYNYRLTTLINLLIKCSPRWAFFILYLFLLNENDGNFIILFSVASSL